MPALGPGGSVVMSNPGAHKGKAVRQAIRQADAKLIFLPKYSPDLSPIEQIFAKLKHLLRKAAQRSRDAVGQIPDSVTPQECKIYFTEAG